VRTLARTYRILFLSRVQAQLSYRLSFTLDLLGSVLVAIANLVEVYAVFHNVKVFGGLDFTAALMVYGIAECSFGIANAVAGNLDTVPMYIRTGTLDTLLLRPLPALGQLFTAEVTVRRIGQALFAAAVLVVALTRADIHWTPARAVLLVSAPVSGGLVFAAIFLLAGSAQFWLLDGGELTSSVTYGGSYAASFSAAVMPLPLRVFFGFVVPAAFVGYLPTLCLLNLPGPRGLPAWLGWWSPAAAVLAWALALLTWRAGLRHYTGAGG
jgi:ABC-2 type transport system permease protein